MLNRKGFDVLIKTKAGFHLKQNKKLHIHANIKGQNPPNPPEILEEIRP